KSGVLRWFVSLLVSVQVEPMSIVTAILATEAWSGVSSAVPRNDLNPPWWLPVTFEPMNSIFEPSSEAISRALADGSAVAVAVAVSVPVAAGAGTGFSTTGLGGVAVTLNLSSAGLAHPETTRRATRVVRARVRVIGMSPVAKFDRATPALRRPA